MPPWSSRLLSGGSSSSTPNNITSTTPTRHPSNSAAIQRDKQLPRPPQENLDPPTLDPDRIPASPTRPRAGGTRQHTHSRSASNPLPKLFGRKKSNQQLGSFNDTDVPLDDDLVPVLDEASNPAPSRVISGKKGKIDEDDKAMRKCMCCDSRVRVPRDLSKFRCMCCLTINDLKPVEEQSGTDKDRPQVKRAGTYPGKLAPGVKFPLSIEHTRALIDRCVLNYLEARCRKEDQIYPGQRVASPKEEKDDVFQTWQQASELPVSTHEEEHTARRLEDPPVSSSPPDTPHDAEAAASTVATIRDINELNKFSGMRIDTPPPEHFHNPPGGAVSQGLPSRKPVPIPARPSRRPPPPPVPIANRRPSQRLLPSGSLTPTGPNSPHPQMSPRFTAQEMEERRYQARVKTIFRPLEEYLIANFGDYQCINKSFSTLRVPTAGRTRSESNIVTPPPEPTGEYHPSPVDGLSELDAKTLLLGDIGENGSWWTGKLGRDRADKTVRRKRVGEGSKKAVSSKSANINWKEVDTWYEFIHTAGHDWQTKVTLVRADEPTFDRSDLQGDINFEEIEDELAEGREHAVRTLLKITENLLKRPSRPLKEPEDMRFLLILISNPSLYPGSKPYRALSTNNRPAGRSLSGKANGKMQASPLSPRKSSGREGSQHNGLLKRIFGLIAHSSDSCHRYLVNWFARFEETHFVKTVDLVASFVNHRIARRAGRPHRKSGGINDGGLIPDLSGSAMNTSAQLHSAMGLSGSLKKGPDNPSGEPDWASDWQIKAAAKVMSLLFAANNIWQGQPREIGQRIDSGFSSAHQAKAKRSGQLLHTSSFYNTLLDYQDMIADFKIWETRRDKFAFCQYPLFLSMGTKIKILEYDARRQMEIKAREAYFDQVIQQRAIDGNFHLRVRRECMVDDSLRQISSAVGAGQEELKKGLRVHFTGEEGVDAGGPRKEWFLMLVRDIFDPNHGMFVYDDESQTCYFNAHSFETSDQFYLVGALLGLAIYNSTILDVAFPPFAFRKLLAAAPSSIANTSNVSSLTGTKGQMTYTISDLAEFRPSLAAGLQQLLDFEGDVEATYCRDFVAPVERYGTVIDIPIIPNGENTPVTNANRHDFVDAYVRYLLDTAVSRQFEPFKRGFFTVCAGNALSLFRAEEIELLIRGSDEALDVDSLRAVATYENWKHFQPPHSLVPNPADNVLVVVWFWELFAEATPEKQRKLLTFITGTDRIPAVGATSLVLRIVAGGDGWGGGGEEERMRFPVARTCFNMLVLWRYDYREQLEERLWRAVEESEGFGLK
ncbi:hypothetical protein M409DRAFT_20412 [Zasmidium cellare ATCC 36951]|uniref:HECT-type E3 ubiquitin transferase n=1 Tax=Zasmidium cellare ATCC 36951 TaxID=1080233 RepID=A0A6A6CTT4_ZASCE|nr:uncharacterized protein M409DRAFT_20412 [Zasmidium cellare ATCC 36951]KAF2169189.1 hypothetical protein M409DRAFT_20412 [Zasmidium cellare ATCC 36951]